MSEGNETGQSRTEDIPAILVKQVTGVGAESTSHMIREELFTGENAWVGVTYAQPGESGWHHHGDMDTYIYVLEGRAVVEYGPGGKQTAEVTPGSVAYVARGLVHRDINPGPGRLVGFLVRVGPGPDVVNVSGPDQE